jgi:hypothetical protein
MIIECDKPCKCQYNGRCLSGDGNLTIINPFSKYPVSCLKNIHEKIIRLVMSCTDGIYTEDITPKYKEHYDGK